MEVVKYFFFTAIERTAVVESYGLSPLRLRFLEPDPQGGSNDDFVLTAAGDHARSKDYVAVSYVWAHE
jgi:hypothetical protein